MPSTDLIKIGPIRMSKSRFWTWIYRLIALLIAFMFISALVYTILFGKNPNA